MKTLYLDCGMGAAGDMLTAALLELLPDQEGVVEELNRLGIPGVQIVRERTMKCGIQGTHMRVLVDGREESADMFDTPVHYYKHRHGHEVEHEHAHDEEYGHETGHGHAHDEKHDHEHGHVLAHDHEAEHGHVLAQDHEAEHSHAHAHEQILLQ